MCIAPIYSLKERRPSGDGAPSISIAFRGEKIVRATPARRDAVPLIGRQAPDKGGRLERAALALLAVISSDDANEVPYRPAAAQHSVPIGASRSGSFTQHQALTSPRALGSTR
jgi:hypothetical protein